ncbi:MAG: DEAD/DEAH box helicase [Acidimicrobiia bacterium]|nr:DEAD/DEAH box helicase [Acidimicrobiia bacterium]
MKNPYDATEVLAGLKDFQRNTVDYVFERMHDDNDPAMRFLVADEVGLGKTLVARGLVAKTVEHLQRTRGKRRIDVVYVCSNSDIAAQNIRRLALPGSSAYTKATRLTLLPLELKRSSGSQINFVAFTPNTSFNLRSSMGTATERALLHVLLTEAWGKKPLNTSGGRRILKGWVSKLSDFEWYIGFVHRRHIDPKIAASFERALQRHDAKERRAGRPGLRDRFDELSVRFRYGKKHRPDQDYHDRNALIGELRQLLAKVCLDSLKPDLVILDEFQRFRNLLEPTNEAGELARDLFEYGKVRVLLLSATPYKMYSLSDDRDDDHYRDFLRTARFLMNGEVGEFARHLEQFRRALFERGQDGRRQAIEAKLQIEAHLRKVMARTERLAVSADRRGMLQEQTNTGIHLEPQDLKAFLATTRISRALGAGSAVEYWKSAPYLLNFMDGYKLIREFNQAGLDKRSRTWRSIRPLLDEEAGLVPWDQYQAYQRIDPENARLRGLLDATTGVGAWQLLWMPPALPYYAPGPPFNDPRLANFTKRLVFSAWNVVPKVIASLVSYDAERHMMNGAGEPAENTPEARTRIKPLLQFKTSRGQFGGMSTFALLYPSPSLARLGDPLTFAAKKRAGSLPVPVEEMLDPVERRITQQLRPLTRTAPKDGPIDQRWYWAAPLLLDQKAGLIEGWFGQDRMASLWISTNSQDEDEPDLESDTPEGTTFADFLDYACSLIRGQTHDRTGREIRPLGRTPDDLPAVLAELALAAPGNVALRSLTRGPNSDSLLEDTAIRNGAASIAWAVRNLFNLSDVQTMIRNNLPYWRQVNRYCLNGNLQAIMDEYVHVLSDWLGRVDGNRADAAEEIAAACREAIGLRTVGYVARDVVPGENRGGDYRFRSRFALRFGNEKTEDKKELERASSVRAAFNSPFWPFVLATTSIGQEGLDFHLYCHAVVHWNLPGNPVDLEQREGRVHRYKGHAVRKNLAAKQRKAALSGAAKDPWTQAFDSAVKQRRTSENDLIPYWLYPIEGGATIDRYVPSLPMSREIARLADLKKALTLYRLVFGQPRQEDLVAYLLGQGMAADEIEKLVQELRIDLTPPS